MATSPTPYADSEDEDPIAFDRDFAPLKQQYFRSVYSNPKLSAQARQQMSVNFSNAIDSGYAERQKIREGDEVSKSRALQYKAAEFQLTKAREDAVRERTMLEALPAVTAELDSIINSGAAAEDKQQAIAQWGVKNAGLLSTNRAAGMAYDAARTGVVKKPKEDAFTVFNVLRDKLPLDQLLEEAKAAGKPFDPNDPNASVDPLVYAKFVNRYEKEFLTNEAQTKAEKERREQERTRLTGIVDGIASVKFADKGDDEMNPMSAPDWFKSKADRAAVERLIDTLGTPEEKAAAKAAGTSASKSYEIARQIRQRYDAEATASARPADPKAPASGVRNLFAE